VHALIGQVCIQRSYAALYTQLKIKSVELEMMELRMALDFLT